MIPYLSLFSGAGLLDFGLHEVVPKLACVAACELDPTRRQIFGAHFPDALLFGDVAEVAGDTADDPVDRRADHRRRARNLFSTANTSAGNTREISDGPARYAFDLVSSLRPRWCLFESSGAGTTWSRWVPAVRRELYARGHSSVCVRLCPAIRGAPHERPRAFVFSWRAATDADGEIEPARALHAEVARLRSVASAPWDGRIPPGLGCGLAHGSELSLARAIGFGVDQRSAREAGHLLSALLEGLDASEK